MAATLTAATSAMAAPAFTTLASYPSPGTLAAGRGVIALTQRSATSATLLIGRGGAAPVAASGIGPLPAWAVPHVGTDRAGRTVVVYPRCGDGVATCDLYAYDVAAARESRLGTVDASGLGELEGSMERGAIAFTRWRLATEPQPSTPSPADRMFSVATTLSVRPVGGPVRRLTKRGGYRIALRGHQVVQVRDINPAVGSCGSPSVELVDTRTATRRTVRTYRCGEAGHSPVGPGWVSGRLVWLMNGEEPAFSERTTTGRVLTEHLAGAMAYPISAYAPVSRSTAVVLQPGPNAGSPYTLALASGIAPSPGG